jgi:hypothetical protein
MFTCRAFAAECEQRGARRDSTSHRPRVLHPHPSRQFSAIAPSKRHNRACFCGIWVWFGLVWFDSAQPLLSNACSAAHTQRRLVDRLDTHSTNKINGARDIILKHLQASIKQRATCLRVIRDCERTIHNCDRTMHDCERTIHNCGGNKGPSG